MKFSFFGPVVLLLVSCATRTPQTDSLLKDKAFGPRISHITNVPFIKQKENHCGPATLKMLMEFRKKNVSLSELTTQMYTPKEEGTFQTDMISAVRRQKMLPVELHDMKSLLKEIQMGNPVIVFQNLGLESLPQWHYSVVTGYNLNGPDVIVHSGPYKDHNEDLRNFERTWQLTNYWGIVVLEPGQLSASGKDLAHVQAASGLEQLGFYAEAELSYQEVLKKWPGSLLAMIGMGNILYQRKDLAGARSYLEKATLTHPESPMAWHNLALIQGELGNIKAARVSAKLAFEKVTPENKKFYSKNLRAYLDGK